MDTNPQAIAADGFVPRLALFYAGLFLATGMQMPFFPAWLAAKGLDPQAIGLVLATPMVTRVIAIPMVTRLADRREAVRGVLMATAVLTVVGYAILGLAGGFVFILAAFAIASTASTPTMPLADAYALRGLGLRRRAYGPVRLWGSVAFVAANIVGGIVLDALPRADLIWLILAGFVAMAAGALRLAPIGASTTLAPPRSVGQHSQRAGFLMVSAAASLVQASHAVYYGFSTLGWSAKGIGGSTIGALWALGVLSEIVVFAASARLPAGIGPATLLALGAAGAVVRWIAMGADPPLALLPVLQCLHGLSFGATHLGAVLFLAQLTPDRGGATAQGDFSTLMGVVGAVAMLASGLLYGACGDRAYAGMAALAAAGGGFALVARRLRAHRDA